jgi:hypothetical protein
MTSVQYGLATIDRDALTAAAMPVEAPALVANPINLVRSSRIPADTTGGRWVNGFAYTPEGIGLLGVADACSPEFQEMLHADPFTSDWFPYVLTAEVRCSTFGYSQNDYKGRATRLLEAATPKLLEWEFWGGPLSQAAGLENSFLTEVATSHASTAIPEAFGWLENLLGDCGYGGRGMIHCPPAVVPYIGQFVRREGNLLLTLRDTIVVPGSGYARYAAQPGVGAPVKPSFDIIATGVTDVRLGDITVEDDVAIDRATNTVVIKAQRYACVSWDELCEFKVTVTPA